MTTSRATKIYNADSESSLASFRRTFRTYYYLTKPGIIRGNLLTATAGFLLASQGDTHYVPLAAALAGLASIIASACVCNNYMDQDIDRKMERTKERALVTGATGGTAALLFAAVLGMLGVIVLVAWTNALTACLAVFGFIAYVLIYGATKRQSVHGTAVGSISGSIPPVVGYVAASGRIDLGAVIFFVILVCWQMPHFYAIAIYRAKDYRAAGIPVLPVKDGLVATKFQIIAYIIVFTIVCIALYSAGYAGKLYAVIVLLLGGFWSWQALRGFKISEESLIIKWARQMFGWSLLVILGLCIAIGADSFIG